MLFRSDLERYPDPGRGEDRHVAQELDRIAEALRTAIARGEQPAEAASLLDTLRRAMGARRQGATETPTDVDKLIQRIQALLKDDIAADHRKLYSTESFITSSVQDYYNAGASSPRPPEYSLNGFLTERRAYLLSYPGIARPPAAAAPKAP